MTIFKIRYKDGKFSTGGMYPHFTECGKGWTSLSKLKQHLTMVRKYKRLPDIYKDCVIVEYVLSTVQTFEIDHFSKGDS